MCYNHNEKSEVVVSVTTQMNTDTTKGKEAIQERSPRSYATLLLCFKSIKSWNMKKSISLDSRKKKKTQWITTEKDNSIELGDLVTVEVDLGVGLL